MSAKYDRADERPRVRVPAKLILGCGDVREGKIALRAWRRGARKYGGFEIDSMDCVLLLTPETLRKLVGEAHALSLLL